jgi:tRNA A37 threonylcarbamoyladenosine dehydratase
MYECRAIAGPIRNKPQRRLIHYLGFRNILFYPSAVNSYEARFSAIGRLFGPEAAIRLSRAHVCVIGIGGVGSWAAESLARSGIGEITLIDLDDVCIGNTNRQLHALDGQFGKPKVEVMAQRLKAINPECVVHAIHSFFLKSNAGELLRPAFDFVLDAIDSPARKCVLISLCRTKSIPVITVGASAGRRDPTAITVVDLAFSSHDRLLQEVRKKLRARHGFSRGETPFGVECVLSREAVVIPYHETVCVTSRSSSDEPDLRLDCDTGYGSASFVTGAFGLVAASRIVQSLATYGKLTA